MVNMASLSMPSGPIVVFVPDYHENLTVVPNAVMDGLVSLPDGRKVATGRMLFQVFAVGGPYAPQGFNIGTVDPANEQFTSIDQLLPRILEIANEYFRFWKLN